MKIFKKLLIICCFSFLFFVCNVKANSYSTVNFNSSMMLPMQNYLTNNPDKTEQDFINNIISIYDVENTDFDYYLYFLNKISDNSYDLYYIVSEDKYYIDFIYNMGNYHLDLKHNKDINNAYYYRFQISFDNNGNISNIINREQNQLDNYYTFVSMTTNQTFTSLFIASNYETILYRDSNSYNFKVDNLSTIYEPGQNIPMNFYQGNSYNFDVRDVFSTPENPNKCISYDIGGQIGTVRNVKSISFRVRDTSNVLNFPIEGYFRLVSSQFNDIMIPISDYLDVSVEPGPLNEGDYNFNYEINWVNENGETINDLTNPRYAIYFDYDLIAEDDIDTYLDVIITLRIKDTIPAGNVTFFDNPVQIFANIYNCNFDLISYGYVDNNNNYTSSDSVLINYLQDNNLGNISSLINTDIIGDGPVDSILLLPLNIMRNLLNVLNTNTCQPLVLPLPFLNSNITLPCVNTLYNQINGLSTFLNWFSAIASAFILYEYFINLYKWVDNLLTFRENNHFGGF